MAKIVSTPETTRNGRKETIKLFHFTRHEYLSGILNNGLNCGDIPLSQTEGVMGISLTEIPDANRKIQSWVAFVPEKLRYRLTVELEPSERLMRWRYVPTVIRMDKAWWKKLNGEPYKWWVYFGVIPPQKIAEIYDTERKVFLPPNELEKIKALRLVQAAEYATKFTWVSFEDAQNRRADMDFGLAA